MKCSLGISDFLDEVSSLSILLFSSISLHWSLRKAFLSLLAILWNSAFKQIYLSFSPLLFTSLLFTAICKASSDSHFAFLLFFFMGMILHPVSCIMSRTSIHSSSSTLSIMSSPLNLGSITTNKASGGNGIPVELLQILKDEAVKMLHSICQQIWNTQQWPQDWNMSVFIPIPKKGNARECSNYHTIALISHASKVMIKILQASLQQYVNHELPDV